MDEEIAMPMYTHDDCYFADDAPSGACEGVVLGPITWNPEALTEAELVRYRAVLSVDVLCDRHRAMAGCVDWDGTPTQADIAEAFEGVGWHGVEIDIANGRT